MSSYVAVKQYEAPNWHTASGVRAKRKLIESKGLPSFSNWRFITLTLERDGSPLDGYLRGKDKMRRFLASLRKILDRDKFRWAWKLEFHEDGWPHWHLLVDYRRRLSHSQLSALREAWGLGRTNVERVRPDSEFLYTFKYAFKPAFVGETESCVPYWFAEHVGYEKVKVGDDTVTKPVSFSRVRFWQTSRGFYLGKKRVIPRDKKDPQSSFVPYPLSLLIEWASRRVQVIAYNKHGYRKSGTILLDKRLSEIDFEFACASLVGLAAPMGISQYLIPAEMITSKTTNKCRLVEIIRKNKLTPKQVFQMQGTTPGLLPF